MSRRSFQRHLYSATFLLLAALPASPATLLAQAVQGPQEPAVVPPADMEGIGPPQLRRYQLPGERVTPSRPQATQPAPAAPPATKAPPRPRPPATAPVQVRDATPDRSTTRPTSPATEPATGAEQNAANSEASVPATDPLAAAPLPLPAPIAFAPPPPSAPEIEEASATSLALYWPYMLAIAIGGALIALLLLRTSRRRDEDPVEFQIVDDWPLPPMPEPAKAAVPAQARASAPPQPQEPTPAQAPLAPPTPPQAPPAEAVDAPSYLLRPVSTPAKSESTAVPTTEAAKGPAGNGVVGIQLRPWLQLEFKPDRASATLTEATVQFELVIANTGNAAAKNVRVEARMFNAGTAQEEEISAFFAAPVSDNGDGRILAIPARNIANFRSVVTMPKQDVREFEVNGRRLFIPTVAINVCYEWGEGKTGQTSMSYIVGRETETPSAKMGPFRLDLGPRVYRQIGQRPSQPAVLV